MTHSNACCSKRLSFPEFRIELLIIPPSSSTTRYHASGYTFNYDKVEDHSNHRSLNYHLRNACASQSLAADELLALETGKRVEDSGDEEEDGGSDQTGGSTDETSPLNCAKADVHGGAHPVGRDFANELIELAGGRADAEKEGHFDEEDDRGGNTAGD